MRMDKERKNGPDDTAENDELDDAVTAADDTGMIAQQQHIVDEEILLGEEGKSLEDR